MELQSVKLQTLKTRGLLRLLNVFLKSLSRSEKFNLGMLQAHPACIAGTLGIQVVIATWELF